jgi:hypothetical protein
MYLTLGKGEIIALGNVMLLVEEVLATVTLITKDGKKISLKSKLGETTKPTAKVKMTLKRVELEFEAAGKVLVQKISSRSEPSDLDGAAVEDLDH